MKIKSLRESKGMTQDQLAGIIGTSRSTVAMWESGSNEPRAQMLVKLAEVFGCTTDELLGYEPRQESREEIIARRVAEARAGTNPGK